MLVPSRRLLYLLGALWLLAVVASLLDQPSIWIVAATLLLVVAVIDAIAARVPPAISVVRLAPRHLALGVEREIELRFVTESRRHRLTFVDHPPAALAADDRSQRIVVVPGQYTSATYRIKPTQRGEFAFGPVEMRVATATGLWLRRIAPRVDQSVRIYPNYSAVADYALLAIDHRLSQIGVLRRRRRGSGADFHQLRDYREGDSQRQVDWKASSRAGRLISREYQDERDQQIILMIDCGRRMGSVDNDRGVTHLDHALDAALLLAHVGLRQGDAVGISAFGGASRWMKPQKSLPALDTVLNEVFDLQPTLSATDYQAAASELMVRMRKRALVVIMTNLRDEDDDTLSPALRLLSQRHLVLLANLREVTLDRLLGEPVVRLDDAVTYAATADYVSRRELAFRRMTRAGAVCIDVEPSMLAISVVNRYLDLKRGARL